MPKMKARSVQIIIATGCSMKCRKAARSSAPTAPSTTRWSHASVTVIWLAEGDPAIGGLDRPPRAGAGGEDGGVRRVDDGREFAHAEHAEIGHRAGAALDLGGRELAGASTGGEVLHLARNGEQRLVLGPTDHRRDQAAIDRHGNADVGGFEPQDAVLRPHCIGGRHALQRQRERLDDEIIERQLERGSPAASGSAAALASRRTASSRSMATSATR